MIHKKMGPIIVASLIISMIIVTTYIDGVNLFTRVQFDEKRVFSIYNLNIWQLVSMTGVVITCLSFIFAFYIGINNLRQISYNDYIRTKAYLTIELKQVGKVKMLVLRNSGKSSAYIEDIKWTPSLLRGDLVPQGLSDVLSNQEKPVFSSKQNKYLQPLEEIKYYISGETCNIYKKISENKEFNVVIKWTDYKLVANKLEYTLDFNNESVEGGTSKTSSKDILDKVDQIQDNIVQVIKEHAFDTKPN